MWDSVRRAICLAFVCFSAACQSNAGSMPDAGSLFANCPEITAASPTITQHVLPGGKIDPCAPARLAWLGIAVTQDDNGQPTGYVVATEPGLHIVVIADAAIDAADSVPLTDSHRVDINTTKVVQSTGYRIVVTGPVHVSFAGGPGVMVYQPSPEIFPTTYRYVMTDGAPVTFTAP
jgi:hypothetical protein